MAYKIVKYLFRNVEVSRDILVKLIDSMDADGNGRISLAEVAVAMKMLWKKAMGKVKEPKVKVLE